VTRGARVLLLGPYVLLLTVFFTVPLLLMLAISLSRQSFGQLEWTLTPQHYIHFFTDAYYLGVLADTLWLGAITTVVSLLLGYPLAYHLALTRSRWKPLLIVFILSPLLVGIGTFVLPCGFTQSMQLYALTTGSFMHGALTMFVFALGTFPVLALLSFGSLNVAHKPWKGIFFKTAGIIVIVLALLNLANALATAGIINPLFNL